MPLHTRLTAVFFLVCLILGLQPGYTTAQDDASNATLKQQLDATNKRFSDSMAPAVVNNINAAIKEVQDSGILANAKNEGDAAPDFTLPDAAGHEVNLYALLKQGPVVLTWYRGNWWPYCNLQLHDYQKILTKIHQAGAELVAVSPTTPDNSLNMAQKNALQFKVLSDIGNKAAKTYGIVYKLPGSIRQYYQQGGMIDLSKYNADDSMELPLAVTYVIDKDGIIRYAYLNADYRKRAETSVVLQEVQWLAEDE